MNVAVVSGIWPPDQGGPAVHAPALAAHLHAHRHGVEVVTTAAAQPATEAYPVHWVPRSLPPGVRHAQVTRVATLCARRADVVYATSMMRRAASGAALARRPLVAKLVADEAFERARRSGVFEGTLEEFQELEGGPRLRALRASRTAALRRAAVVVSPSAYLRDIALGWGIDPARIVVVPNPAPDVGTLPPREQLRTLLGLDGFVLAFAGRLTAQKALDVALDALARVPQARLLLRGDGPERARLESAAVALGLSDRVRWLGPGTREDVLRLFAAADAVLVTSAWENLPHTVLEALAVGTPVIATSVGGIPEIVRDGENGLLVPPGDADAVAAAALRLAADDGLRRRLRAAARPSVADLSESVVLARIVDLLGGVVTG